jgi:ATP-binding cassette subfamily B protein RaxB
LARALYGRPRILVLDEGTANLDEVTEEAIADLIAKMPITRIVVAHRPALIRRASRILLVKDRRISEVSSAHAGAPLRAAQIVDISRSPAVAGVA